MNLITRFTEEFVSLAKSYFDDADEPAAPEGGGRFADYAIISLHGLRIFLEESYEMIINRLEVMPPILLSRFDYLNPACARHIRGDGKHDRIPDGAVTEANDL